MIVLLLFAFISGFLTILAPCIWPILPIVLSTSATGGKARPIGLTIGIVSSFGLLTLTLSTIVHYIPFDPDYLRYFAVVVIAFFGLALVWPKLTAITEVWLGRIANRLRFLTPGKEGGFKGGLIAGLALGIIWTPCAGPILATIATLAASRQVSLELLAVTVAYSIGLAIPLLAFALLGQRVLGASRSVSRYTGLIQQILGLLMILTALAIATGYDRTLQARLLDRFPGYGQFLINLESNAKVKKELDRLRQLNVENDNSQKQRQISEGIKSVTEAAKKMAVLDVGFGQAPELTGISRWHNTVQPLSLKELRGKVVLIDFWTYTCVNCLRTLPFVSGWYEQYKDEGLVVIGVHTPEFEFEKKAENVQAAIKQRNIHYPVAQDNNYETWRAYRNQYWPAKYLIDANGVVRKYHFGEGGYADMEEAIRKLLAQAGQKINQPMLELAAEEASREITPETYLGSRRNERFASRERLREGRQSYTAKDVVPLHSVALVGPWTVDSQAAISESGSALKLRFKAKRVMLVIDPPSSGGGEITLRLDGEVVPAEIAGRDVRDGTLRLDRARLYELINLPNENEDHLLEIEVGSAGVGLYAFTFG